MSSTPEVIKSIDALCPEGTFQDEDNTRIEAIVAARRLLSRLQTPFEQIASLAYFPTIAHSANQIILELGIWESWAAKGGQRRSLSELVDFAETDVNPNLLRRLLRILAAHQLVIEADVDVYEPTRFSLAMGKKDDSVPLKALGCSYMSLPAALNLPKFLAKTNYKVPQDPVHSNCADTWPEESLSLFERCKSYPQVQKAFVGGMSGWTKAKCQWPTFYGTTARLLSGYEPDSGPLVVDIGGNIGIDLSYFLAAHPDLPSNMRLMLQDLPAVIAMAREGGLDHRIEAVEHDFFTPQPPSAHGARAYFMHSILRDWPDEKTCQILGHVRDAMKKGYSRLLIGDVVLPDTGASLLQATLDMHMMSLLSAGLRTERDWKNLLEGGMISGLRVVKFWRDPRGYEAIIEVEAV